MEKPLQISCIINKHRCEYRLQPCRYPSCVHVRPGYKEAYLDWLSLQQYKFSLTGKVNHGSPLLKQSFHISRHKEIQWHKMWTSCRLGYPFTSSSPSSRKPGIQYSRQVALLQNNYSSFFRFKYLKFVRKQTILTCQDRYFLNDVSCKKIWFHHLVM